MEIVLNGEPTDVPDRLSVADLIQRLSLENKRLALELNREIVPRSCYDEVTIKPGDAIEIVHAIGGG